MTNQPDHQARAPYALPEGVPALQEDPVHTRRWLLATGAVCFFGGAGIGHWIGRGASVAAGGTSTSSRREWARRIAASRPEVVLENSTGFLALIDVEGGDEVLWVGVDKLIALVVSNPEIEAGGLPLRERLVRTLTNRRSDLPRASADGFARLLGTTNRK